MLARLNRVYFHQRLSISFSGCRHRLGLDGGQSDGLNNTKWDGLPPEFFNFIQVIRMDTRPQTTEQDVLERYASASEAVQPSLCCAVSYDPRYLEAIPQEIIDKDYGCGDPSQFIRPGDVVLDLGSGSGKICYIASQIVGKNGRVIGVDFNPPMLALARKYQRSITTKIGWDNVSFRYGKIQDLQTDYEKLDAWLKVNPVASALDMQTLEQYRQTIGEDSPMIASDSVDVIVSNCVLNLVQTQDKGQLFREMHRVLKVGGRAAISDIVSDRDVPQNMRDNPELWSGCISGAFQERAFLRAFEEAGFYGVTIEKREEDPWQVVEGIAFRSVTVMAYKSSDSRKEECTRNILYKGPWACVTDEAGHCFERGVPSAVSEAAYQAMQAQPYTDQVVCLVTDGTPSPQKKDRCC